MVVPQISNGLRQPAARRSSSARSAGRPGSRGARSSAVTSRCGVVIRSLTARITAAGLVSGGSSGHASTNARSSRTTG